MTRQDNPILLWLHAEAEHWQQHYHRSDEPQWKETWWLSKWNVLDDVLDVCRWLDAEDAWRASLPSHDPDFTAAAWVLWRRARMAEAGVL